MPAAVSPQQYREATDEGVAVTVRGRQLRLHSGSEAEQADATVRRRSETVYTRLRPELGTWTGGSIWESAHVLSQYLLALPSPPAAITFWERTRVLELGCGVGLAGFVAACLGAQQVVLTDRITHIAKYNRDLNFPPDEHERVQVRELLWGTGIGAARYAAAQSIRLCSLAFRATRFSASISGCRANAQGRAAPIRPHPGHGSAL
jgi:hypothetical protein